MLALTVPKHETSKSSRVLETMTLDGHSALTVHCCGRPVDASRLAASPRTSVATDSAVGSPNSFALV